ncbi:hypothetical protein NE237_027559 [Protea cynaroides]|uniref:Uncharacterized protein n=1 Tax=Protea cynaroides TaxID=273540 RepID=A0A9Q0GRK5_9MAGN|nr:hypothetical protein NE237_027559 [Protea cynaroides]
MSDVFVMRAWGEHLRLSLGDKLMMLSDGHGELSRALGLSVDFSKSSDGASLEFGGQWILTEAESKGDETLEHGERRGGNSWCESSMSTELRTSCCCSFFHNLRIQKLLH